MQIDVDYDRCEGHGMCEEAAPSIFRLDDEGELILLLETVPPELERQANEAVRVCPVAALSVRSD